MKAACLIVFVIQAIACGQVSSNGKVESTAGSQVQKDSCDNPDADINCSFIHMPSSLNNVLTIAGKNESGERMVISGKVFKSDGKTPYSNVILYAYQTDSEGYYSKSGKEQGAQKWHGRLHAWCKTDRYGKYQIQSIRPAPYPSNTMPAHIHMAIKEPQNKPPYYITDFVFKDDPLVNDRYLKSINQNHGGTGIVDLIKENKAWIGKRDILQQGLHL